MPFGIQSVLKQIGVCLVTVGLLSAQDSLKEERLKSQIRILINSLKDANRTAQEALAIHNPEKKTFSPEKQKTLAEALAEIELLRAERDRLKDAFYQLVDTVQSQSPDATNEITRLVDQIEAGKSNVELSTGVNQANVIGTEPKTGLVILNVGAAQGVKPGMRYVFFGSDSKENMLVVADVREQIAGAMVQEGASPISLGLEVNLVIEN